jgi:hypothetical protein
MGHLRRVPDLLCGDGRHRLCGRYVVLGTDGQSQHSAHTEYSLKSHGFLPVKRMWQINPPDVRSVGERDTDGDQIRSKTIELFASV